MTDQSTSGNPKVQLDESMSFTTVSYRNIGKGLLSGEINSKIVFGITKSSAQPVTAHKCWNPEEHSTTADSSTGWRASFPVSTIGAGFIQAPQLVFASPK